MSKAVVEADFKFFNKYVEALMGENFFVETIEVEGGSPPNHIESKKMKGMYRLKTFQRVDGDSKFLEKVYLKI